MGALVEKREFKIRTRNFLKNVVDILHHALALAAIKHIDLTRTIFEKDKTAAVNYQHKHDLEGFLKGK